MLEDIKKDLGVNYHESDDTLLTNYIERYKKIASNASNRTINDELINPYVYDAVKSAFLRRGDEGTTGASEGGLSSSYLDIEEKLHRDCLSIRKGKF